MSNLENLKGYTIVEKKKLKEVDGTGYVLSHNKTKARILVVENSDNNKVFTIGFRTPPVDDCGTAHIMEHSVLCGSKKFPVKDPFVELCKGSLNTFLNAMTYSDKTVYPVASLNKIDFHNLLHVYMDAVFYPNIFDREEIMMQEGWHYEIDEETNELKYNGVVYNEMKGVYSSADEQLYRIIQKSLLENTPYGYESGGDPEHITELTRERFLEFHDMYYHPSNSYIYLYGDMDAEKELQFIDDNYLSNYDYQYVASEIAEEKAFDKPKDERQEYSLASTDDEKDNTYLAYNVIAGSSLDKKLTTAMSVLEYALITAPGAPLKKKLIDAGIGKDVYSSYDDGIKQTTFSIIAKNANESDKQRFIELIDSCLSELVTEGINKRSLEAAINRFEFKHKEGNYGRFPKGLMLGLDAFNTWLYDDSAALELFSMNEVYDQLKKEIDNGYFEGLIKTYFLENNHKSYVVLAPKKGLNDEKELEIKNKLAVYKATLSQQELDDIAKAAEHLKVYQSEPSTPEELETIPVLSIDDIDKNARRLNNQFTEIEKVQIVSHDVFTNGISYVSLNFDVTDIEDDRLPVLSLLTEIFKDVDTGAHSYNELANEINLYTGGIGFATSITSKKNKDDYVLHFIVNAKMLDEKVDKAFELIDEILFTSVLDDKKRLAEIIAEVRSVLKNDIISSGHTTAAERAISYISPIGMVKQLTDGLEYYRYLSDLDDNFDERYPELVETLKSTLADILRRDALSISLTSDKDPKELLGSCVTELSKKLSTRLSYDAPDRKKPKVLNEGFACASQVQYVAAAGNFRDKGLEYTGRLTVLQSIFSYDYLWIKVRVMGGAYGSMCSFSRSGNVYFTSYRDPKLLETYEIYKNASEYVENFNADERSMTKYIIGAISKLDTPLTPSAEGNFSYVAYLMGLDDEALQKEREEVLSTDVEGIRALAPFVEVVAESGVICALGGEAALQEARDSFFTIENIN